MSEIDIIKNFLYHMPMTYRNRTANHKVVHDILLARTDTAGMTSCCIKCRDLGIDPHGYTLEQIREVGK